MTQNEVDTRCALWALAAIIAVALTDIFLIHLLTGSWGG